MAARGLLYYHLYARPPSYLVDPRHLLPRRSPFSSDGFSVVSFRSRFSSLATLRSVKCMKVEDQADSKMLLRNTPQAQLESSDTDAVEYVNKAAPGPMVEVDPVTVFRRIIAERRASLAMARAKHQENVAAIIQSSSPQHFFFGRSWSGKSSIAIFLALVLLVLAAVSYFLRLRTNREKQSELTLAEGNDDVDVSSDNSRRKLVKDTIKASESVLTAMAIGAASVGRMKGHTGITQDTMHGEDGNSVDMERPPGGVDAKSSASTLEKTYTEDFKTGRNKIPTFEHISSNPEAFGSFKAQNAGGDVTEGPWFAQAADDSGSEQVESIIPAVSTAQDVFENVLPQKQELHSSTEAIIDKLAMEISASEVRYETQPMNNMVDGEFLGELVSVSVATVEAVVVSDNIAQGEDFMLEEPEDDVLLADGSAIVEKLESMIGVESFVVTEGVNEAGNADASETNLLADAPSLELLNDEIGVMDMDTNLVTTDSDFAGSEQHKVVQSSTPLELDKVITVEVSDSEVDDEGQAMGSLNTEEHGDPIQLLSGVEQTLERIETELDDVLADVSLPSDSPEAGIVKEAGSVGSNCFDGGDASATYEPLSASLASEELQTDVRPSCNQVDYQVPVDAALPALEEITGAMAYGSTADAALPALEEDSREVNKKALEAAIPALAVGVGTIGTLFGVAGGLQVVGFAAVASFLSQDFFWAQSREEFYEEVKGITNRQKLLDFLARRNIVRMDQEETTL